MFASYNDFMYQASKKPGTTGAGILIDYTAIDLLNSGNGKSAAAQQLPALQEFEDAELDDMFDDMPCGNIADQAGGTLDNIGILGAGTVKTITDADGKTYTMDEHYPITQRRTVAANADNVAGTGRRPPRSGRGLSVVFRSTSEAVDHRLTHGIYTRAENSLRRLSLVGSMNVFFTFPAYPQLVPSPPPPPPGDAAAVSRSSPWPERVVRSWPDSDYAPAVGTVDMLTAIFDECFAVMPISFSWLNVEQLLQLWLTLNSELAGKAAGGNNGSGGVNPSTGTGGTAATSGLYNFNETPKIPFGPAAIDGLLTLLCSQQSNSLRTWFLSFQCLIMACNPVVCRVVQSAEGGLSVPVQRMAAYMVDHPAFERMLVRFYSSTDNLLTAENRNVRDLVLCVCC